MGTMPVSSAVPLSAKSLPVHFKITRVIFILACERSECVALPWTSKLFRVLPCLNPEVAEIGSSIPRNPAQRKCEYKMER